MVVTCPKCGTVINRKEWDEVKNKWKEGNKITNVRPPTTIQSKRPRLSEVKIK